MPPHGRLPSNSCIGRAPRLPNPTDPLTTGASDTALAFLSTEVDDANPILSVDRLSNAQVGLFDGQESIGFSELSLSEMCNYHLNEPVQ
jgi:hypothetical protein